MNQQGFGNGFNGDNPFDGGNFGNFGNFNNFNNQGDSQGKRIVSTQRSTQTRTTNGKTIKVTT